MAPSIPSVDEKQTAEYAASPINAPDPDAQYGGHEERKKLEKKLLMKIDLRMSVLIVIYILNYIDRNNAAAARAYGLETELNLQRQVKAQFPTLLSILYVGYILMQIPSNMYLNWIGKPSIYLPACMLIWGMISILTGITRNFVGALLTRFFLGFVEAAFFPGALFLLSKWYRRDEIGLRTAILFCGNLISNGFGTLVASGILSMGPRLGHSAWRWLFYIEGAITMGVAIAAMFILPDFPETTKWLSPLERTLAIQRLAEDVGVGDQDQTESGSKGSGFIQCMTDWKVWWLALALTSQVVALSFNAYFPTLTATLGYNRTVTLLLCAPPWGFATIMAFIFSRHSDKTGERFYHIITAFLLGIVGFIIAISTMNTAARYVSLFLMAQSYSGFIVLFAWISNTFPRPPSKRAVALAFINAFSQLGNVAGSYVWPNTWGPTYRNSYAICIATSGIAILMCLILKLHLTALNKKLEREDEESGRKEKGFRYLV
ncbi:sugar transporter [Moniliophthora roreri MCA 2997]|uniref:Sugar transporter n=1 Tax=Moniliophthora roreri (strain MCA 2997) TaxID=1381753 RepID=V2XV49_MONRO|nr:sugar transporter [Moniliophthora roreri MCA 2997]